MQIVSASLPAQAAMALDRTRVVFDGSLNSVSLSVSNQKKQTPSPGAGLAGGRAGQQDPEFVDGAVDEYIVAALPSIRQSKGYINGK